MTRYHQLICFALLAGCALGACNNRYQAFPRAVTFAGVEQEVARSAAHWNLMAANEASLITQQMEASPSLFVAQADDTDSPFEQAYQRLLTAQLLAAGANVSRQPGTAGLRLDYDIMVVNHDNGRSLRPRPGFFSTAFAIAAIAGNVPNWEDNELAIIPLALGLDILSDLWRDARETMSEVIVTTTLHDGDRLLRSDARIYYVRDADLANYQTRGKTFDVVGS
ncbi:MAG: hypothetical protein CMQ34_01690 [Gammaproteobacteria bacterium]|nr:hypothetical protein [Gammaproteobacteria bacterium]|tara:strand:- start:4538 stop:5206 length:669 start_codon:yes stop_codon:yes gene_type:complete